MKLHIEKNTPEYTQCILSGEFDALGCLEIRNALDTLLETHSGSRIDFDLAGVSFMDSSGIGALVFMFKRLRTDGGTLHLVNVSGQPRELITLLRVDKAMPVAWAANVA